MNTLAKCVAQPNLTVPYLLMASYLYYIKNEDSPMSDHEYDCLCEYALQNWATIEHRHKHLIKKGWLAAGSLYKLSDRDYPLIVKGAAYSWLGGAAIGLSLNTPAIAEQLRRIADALVYFIGGERLDDLV